MPEFRDSFCSVLSASQSDSSFQMTIYGGWDIKVNQAVEDIYVLSIPAFRWVKVEDTGNIERLLSNQSVGRAGHTCALYKNRQMIVLGGDLHIDGTVQNDKSCNKSYPTIRVLDVSNFTWQPQFSPMYDAYTIPDRVQEVIGGKLAAPFPKNPIDLTKMA